MFTNVFIKVINVLVPRPKVTVNTTVTVTREVKGATCRIGPPTHPQYADYELRVRNKWCGSFNRVDIMKQDLPDIIATLTALYESENR